VARFGRLTLRTRLSIIAVVLVAVGLLVAGLATRYALRSFLLDRVDQQFQPAVQPLARFFVRGDTDPGAVSQVSGVLPPRSYAALVSSDGRILGAPLYFFPVGSAPAALPTIARTAPVGISTIGGYRVDVIPGSATRGNGGPSARLVMATPLSDVNSTLHRLELLELLVGLAVVAGVAALAYAAVRRELRPLERIEDTAAAIASGDLTRRVEEADPGTEVGRLGASLNTMLAQIELAFNERRATESRLRRFVADASHELKTPLTSVRGYAELFRHGASSRPEDLALVMSRIESEAERMGVLVEDLLLLAKLDQRRPIEQEPVDLRGVLSEMVADHGMLHPDWPIELEADGAGDIVGDQPRVRQAIANLLSNARSHTPPGTPISVRLGTAGDARVVEVADRGPGIRPEHLPRVFERFFRADPSRARASGGSGLGLSIVAAIAEAHGGRVEVESPSGEGTTFRLTLPIDGVRLQPDPEQAPPAES
jgi:two-component system, OmpR family, sensor kinase